MKDNSIYYVYIYKDPTTMIPFYIGKGKENRCFVHLKLYPYDKNEYKKNKIRKIQSTGHDPIIDLYVLNVSQDIANIVEIALIKKYGRKDNGTGVLYNLTDGGDRNLGGESYTRSHEQKETMSKRRRNQKWIYNHDTSVERQIDKDAAIPDGFSLGRNPKCVNGIGEMNQMYGVERPDDWRKFMSEWHKTQGKKGEDHPLYGKPRTEDDIRRMREGCKKSFENGRTQPWAKPVIVNGVQYNSISEASKILGITIYYVKKIMTEINVAQ